MSIEFGEKIIFHGDPEDDGRAWNIRHRETKEQAATRVFHKIIASYFGDRTPLLLREGDDYIIEAADTIDYNDPRIVAR